MLLDSLQGPEGAVLVVECIRLPLPCPPTSGLDALLGLPALLDDLVFEIVQLFAQDLVSGLQLCLLLLSECELSSFLLIFLSGLMLF